MKADVTLDCFGMLCPMPIIKTSQEIKKLQLGQILEIIASDEGLKSDLPAWSKSTGQEFLGVEEKDGEFRGYVKKVQ